MPRVVVVFHLYQTFDDSVGQPVRSYHVVLESKDITKKKLTQLRERAIARWDDRTRTYSHLVLHGLFPLPE